MEPMTAVVVDGPQRRKPPLRTMIDQYVGDKWDRQHYETPGNWACFNIYRDLGPTRTIAATAAAMGRGVDYLKELSVKFNWRERAAAWDDYLALVAREETIAVTREMAREHVALGLLMRRKATKAIRSLKAADLAELAVKKPEAIIRMAEGGVKIEREARGLAADEGTEEAGNAQAATRLTRRMLLNPKAVDMAMGVLDLLAEQGDSEVVLNAATGEPLE
jgi:dihydroneopterin aldolase